MKCYSCTSRNCFDFRQRPTVEIKDSQSIFRHLDDNEQPFHLKTRKKLSELPELPQYSTLENMMKMIGATLVE